MLAAKPVETTMPPANPPPSLRLFHNHPGHKLPDPQWHFDSATLEVGPWWKAKKPRKVRIRDVRDCDRRQRLPYHNLTPSPISLAVDQSQNYYVAFPASLTCKCITHFTNKVPFIWGDIVFFVIGLEIIHYNWKKKYLNLNTTYVSIFHHCKTNLVLLFANFKHFIDLFVLS